MSDGKQNFAGFEPAASCLPLAWCFQPSHCFHHTGPAVVFFFFCAAFFANKVESS